MASNSNFGSIPADPPFKRRQRIHQGWWRTNVLNEPPGKHPKLPDQNVCNVMDNGNITKKNFLSDNTIKAVEETLQQRKHGSSGLMEEERLFNNLLSSQPLCFNFFGELQYNHQLGLNLFKQWWPQITNFKRVIFEYAPMSHFDNSAFDVAFEVEINEQTGLIGLECKYTDSFSAKGYHKPEYQEVYQKSSVFNDSYENFTSSRFNQLFRNQLIAETFKINKKYDFVMTGLLCHPNDEKAIETASAFQGMLVSGSEIFKVITYSDFIEALQKLDLTWVEREWSMLLWARYCGLCLSENVNL